ncbi:WG repeat-containing protein [Tenacibaculum tangerinum]|uniref:WG repeat-containing protein n=1 Tax=Tenacibaculum tangerinum TaxID=3038772 RepID=A0ABY8L1N2_9FLAO|nr:WG repeat-containing protein [Tenacibaculum tangerinum]WGH75353.1 WG repeat-containing protein [Tenacibaculum tangerinum]
MKNSVFIIFLLITTNVFTQINIDSNSKAKLYFIEAERNFNQNNFKEASKYIEKTEAALGDTNGRILNLKVKNLYNLGKFEAASEALELFMNVYASSVTAELKADTESYFIKLERYFENKEKKKEEEAIKNAKLRNKALKVARFNEGLGLVYVNGKAGFVDLEGNFVIEPKYMSATIFSDGTSQVKEVKDKAYLIDKLGRKMKSPKNYYWAMSIGGGFAKINTKNEGDYIVSKNNPSFIKGPYYLVYNFSGDRAVVKKKGKIKNKCGFIDQRGKEAIPVQYDYCNYFSEGLAAVKSNGKYGYIDVWGKTVIPFKYEYVKNFVDGLAFVKENGSYQMIDKTGKIVKKFANTNHKITMPDFYNGNGVFELNDGNFKTPKKYGIIDSKGKVTYPVQSTYHLTNYNRLYGLIQFSTTGVKGKKPKYGLMNAQGKKIIPEVYDYFSKLWGGGDYIAAKKNGKYGVIDITGKIIIPFKYEDIKHINKNDIALVKYGGKWIYADANGEIYLR